MNEVLAPIYYTYNYDTSPFFLENLESDCFFSFTKIMTDLKDCFIRNLDDADTGINRRI